MGDQTTEIREQTPTEIGEQTAGIGEKINWDREADCLRNTAEHITGTGKQIA